MPAALLRDDASVQASRLDRTLDALGALAGRIRTAQAVTPALIAEIISDACPRLALLNKAGGAAGRIARLVEASAWTDAAVALIEIELPAWRLRRLVYDDGVWHCSLSRQPALPIEFDDTADAHHPVVALALIGALVEARARGLTVSDEKAAMPFAATPGTVVCCDNFA